MGVHNVVILCLPCGVYGTVAAATAADHLRASFRSLRFGLLVGIGGGSPSKQADIRLWDVVVSTPTENFGGVISHDQGKTMREGVLKRTSTLDKPPQALLKAVSRLRAEHHSRDSQILEYLSTITKRDPALLREFARPPRQLDRLFEAQYEHNE